jgi:hypothetical protein
MEAVAAIGLASGIVQFADCGIRWASSANELYKSGNGALRENSELEVVVDSLRAFVLQLKTDGRLQDDHKLEALVATCLPLADELIEILGKLKVEGEKANRRESIRKALKSLVSRGKIQDIDERLGRIRDQICAHVNYILL